MENRWMQRRLQNKKWNMIKKNKKQEIEPYEQTVGTEKCKRAKEIEQI